MTTKKETVIKNRELRRYRFTALDCCGNERPKRRIMCQLPKGHEGSHRAIVFWEGES